MYFCSKHNGLLLAREIAPMGHRQTLRACFVLLLVAGCGPVSSPHYMTEEDENNEEIFPETGSLTVSLGPDYSCAIDGERGLWCWGDNAYGQLGDGTTTTRNAPRTLGEGVEWSTIAAGGVFRHTCAIDVEGSMFCWGSNLHGEVGDGSTADRSSPVALLGQTWRAVAVGGMHTCGLGPAGALWCWGGNTAGALGLGLGYEPDHVTEPTRVGENIWSSIATAYDRTCGIQRNGTLWCWGESRGGGLGVDIDFYVDSPRQVGSDDDWTAVSGSHLHSCGLKRDGTLWCWGSNRTGQIGHGGTNDVQHTPVQVSDAGWAWISAGGSRGTDGGYSCGVQVDGSLWCWGDNRSYQLGLGEDAGEEVSIPTRVGSDADWTQAATGFDHSCAVKSDDTLWCWGLNSSGQVGDGTTEHRLMPTQIDLSES